MRTSTRTLLAAMLCTLAVAGRVGAQERRIITVTGEAEVRVVPDEAVFTFGIETSNKDIDEAQRENDRRVKDVLALADKLGIERKYVQTNYLSIEPRYEDRGEHGSERRREFVGYYARRDISITLKNLSLFEELLSRSLKLGVNYVGGAQFRTSELRKHRDQARLMAIRAAKEKAVALAGELGAKIGRPVSISEDGGYGMRGGRAMMQNAMDEAPDGGDGSTLAPGQMAVNARVTVTFELE